MIDPKVITEILKANGITSRSAPGSPLGNLTGLPFRDPSEIAAGSAGEALFAGSPLGNLTGLPFRDPSEIPASSSLIPPSAIHPAVPQGSGLRCLAVPGFPGNF